MRLLRRSARGRKNLGAEALALAVFSRDDPVASDDMDIAREVSRILSAEARQVTFEAAVAIPVVDGSPSREENVLLQRLCRAEGGRVY